MDQCTTCSPLRTITGLLRIYNNPFICCTLYVFFFLFVFSQAQAPDDLSVRRGDWIYADLNNQTVDGWLWAYAPKTRKYGFIPKAYARPPAMTSL
jgi:hypothetical protein